MRGFVITCSVVLGYIAFVSGLPSNIDRAPSYYTCPFRMFNGGRPAVNQLGATMYCDVSNATCPEWHFCSYGYPDGRSICCHILGV